MRELFNEISVNPQQGITLAHQVKQQITWLIVSNKLKPGDRLPSIRPLARHLGINLHTVRNAYQMLETAGLVKTRQGWGTQVLSYDLGQIAKSTIIMRSHTVGVIIPSLVSPIFHDFLQGIQEIADKDQTLIYICDTQNEPPEAWRYINQLLARQVDGIILSSMGIEQYLPDRMNGEGTKSLKTPFVSVDWPDARGFAVYLDLETAGYQATKHLLQHSHSRVGLITYVFEAANVRSVNKGYQRALQEAGFEIDPTLIARVYAFDLAAGEEGAKKLLGLPNPPSAIFAITDLLAMGVMKAIKTVGLNAPRDMALVGFNDSPTAALLEPPLTMVSTPAKQMGREAMKMLATLINGKVPMRNRIVLPTSLVTRRSCGCTDIPGG